MLCLCVVTCSSNASCWSCSARHVALDKPHRVDGAYSFSPSFFVEHYWYCLYMSEQTSRPNPIIEQVGEPLTMDDLPPPNIRRWITRRKAEVVTAVRTGLLSLDEACVRYGITSEEFLSWQRLLDEHGLQGLRATRLQKYRLSTKSEAMTDTESADMGAAGYRNH